MIRLCAYLAKSCGIPGCPHANESVVVPAALSWNRLSCAQIPLPAVPDLPIVLWCEFTLRISIP